MLKNQATTRLEARLMSRNLIGFKRIMDFAMENPSTGFQASPNTSLLITSGSSLF